MAPAWKSRGKKTKRKTKTPSSSTLVSSPSTVEPQAAAAETPSIDVLTEFVLEDILRRLSLADLLRAALASHRWRRLAATSSTQPKSTFRSLSGIQRSSKPPPCLLLLEPSESVPKVILPRFLVLDPATRRRTVLPPPPRDTVPDDRRWRSSRYYVGSALLSRTHPTKLCFEAVCFAIDGGHPRAWVASVDDSNCRWRALPRDEQVLVDFDPYWFEGRAVHAAGKIYWHICQSSRLLVLDPSTLSFSYLPVPGELFAHNRNPKYRIGETPDGRLCLVTDAEQQLQLWVRGKGDKGWILERKIVDLLLLCDKLRGRGLPVDPMLRTLCVWPSDMDAGRTGKVFIKTWGFGRFSFHMDTGKMEAPVNQTWQGIWAPYVRLLPRMAARVRGTRELIEFQLVTGA
ncbi:hypothetical protein ACQ4PT_008668 [Festuca glaucescens]